MNAWQIQDELADLRAQLEELQQARQRREATAEPPEPSTLQEEAVQTVEEVAGEEAYTLEFGELREKIDQQLSESQPSTLLAVFALGVLIGRLLPR